MRRDTALRRARTCYGHLAGVAGVRLMDEMVRRGWLDETSALRDTPHVYYAPSAEGIASLTTRGVAIPSLKSGKPPAFSCLDWTERRWHLGGALGRAIADALGNADLIERTPGCRVVMLTGGFESWLDQ